MINHDPRWELNQWVRMVRHYCFPDWVEWKTERTMKSVDSQIEEIQEMMAAEDHEKYVKPIVIEHTPDGSKAQDLLGGTLQIKAPWVDNGLER
jgi:hypothetical protein